LAGGNSFGAAAATAGIMFIKPELVRGAAANSAVRVWIAGVRGTRHRRRNQSDRYARARRVALADLFQDQLTRRGELQQFFGSARTPASNANRGVCGRAAHQLRLDEHDPGRRCRGADEFPPANFI